MLKDLIAIVQGGDQSQAAVDYALAFAQLHQAHLGLTAITERMMWRAALDPVGAYVAAPDPTEEHAREVAAIRRRADAAPVDCDVRGLCEEPLFIPGRADLESRCADLVIIGPQPCWTDRHLRRRVVDAILLDAAAPLLLHPEGWKPEPVRHAVLGWNESAEAARVARVLLTVLEPGASVDVVIIGPLFTPDGRTSEPGSAIVQHLLRHQFQAQLHICPSGGSPVAEALESFAVMRNAHLLAVGAYAHSRLRELVFGGATRDLIESRRVPVLMVH